MQLDRDGARHFPAAFSPAGTAALADLLSLPEGRPGARSGPVPGPRRPVLHASDRAARPRRRWVLQLLYSADDLPDGLAWSAI